jgi:hypothetical protein
MKKITFPIVNFPFLVAVFYVVYISELFVLQCNNVWT